MVVKFDSGSVDFIAHAGNKREMRINTPVVLDVTGYVPTAEIKILRSAVLHRRAVRKPEQKIGEFVRGLLFGRYLRGLAERDRRAGHLSVKCKCAARLRARIGVQVNSADAGAKSYGVFRKHPGEGIGESGGLIARERWDWIIQRSRAGELKQRKAVVNRDWLRHRRCRDLTSMLAAERIDAQRL